VKRDTPRPRLHRVAPSCPVPAPLVFGPGGPHAGRSVDEHEARASVRERIRRACAERQARGIQGALRREATKARVFEGTVSECRSRSDASPDRDARRRHQAPREHARSSSKEEAAAHDERRGLRERAKRCAGPTTCLLTTEARKALAARASLVGIAPGGVRARGLGKSKGRERAVAGTTEGCPGRTRDSLNRNRVLRPWSRG